MEEEREEISCECQEIHEDLLKIVNETMPDEEELYDLADELRSQLEQNGPVEQFLLTVLSHSSIYSPAEITRIHNVLERLKSQNEVEREKYKADNLLQTGEYASAILVYQGIVNKEWDETVGKEFYGQVYGCLGAAYGRMLLYEEAASMYEKGFREMDFNFSWGYMYGIFFAFVGALLVLLRATANADTRKRRIVVAVQWLAYLWHLVCGVYYFWGFLQGAMYY